MHAVAGDFQREGEARELFKTLIREIVTLANAMGITFEEDLVERNLKILSNLPEEATTSMQRDVIEGKHEGDGFSTSKGKSVPYVRDYKKDTISPYILNKYNLTEKLEFTAGFRYEWADYDLAGTDVNRKFDEENKSYEGVLSYKYRDTGNVFFRYEKGFMSPTPGQLGSVEDKSKTLQSETSDTFEIGVKDYITSNTFVSLTFYRLEKDNEINSYKLL